MSERPWHAIARREQLPPEGHAWKVFLINAGRGFGKTRAASEWLCEQAATRPNTRWAVVAPTWRDLRMVCIEGCSGILQALQPGELKDVIRANLIVRLTNGSVIHGFSADSTDRLEGMEFDGVWAEEIGTWGWYDWNKVEKAVPHGQIFATATPGVVAELAVRSDVIHRSGSTWDNRSNLSRNALNALRERYGPDHPYLAGPAPIRADDDLEWRP